ncbi:MAG: MATE family efflux transporter [Clostridia bacterium]
MSEIKASNSNSNEFLGTAPIGKLLFKLAVPSIVAQLINMLYNLVDRIYIGHIADIGSLALTGVGVCLPVIMVVSAFAMLISMGAAPRSSTFMGSGDNEKAEKTMGNAFVLLSGISIILTIILLIWNEPILMLFGASKNTIGYATEYMNIYCIGTIFVQMALGMNAFISAQGFAKVSMISVLIGALLNIVLDPILIFSLNMGVAGAALATIISQAVSAFFIIIFLCSKKTILKLRFRHFALKAKIVLPCLALGLAPFIMQATESLVALCFNSSLKQYGGDIAVGSMTILSSVMMFAMLPLQGLAQGAQPISSYNFGARNPQRVKQVFKLLLICSLIYSTVMYLGVMIFPEGFAKMFTDNAELIAFTKVSLRIYMAVSLIFGLQIACQMTFISIGDAKSSLIVALIRKIALLIPLIYIVPLLTPDKTMGVFLAEPICDLIAVTFTAFLFAHQFRKAMKKLNEPLPIIEQI